MAEDTDENDAMEHETVENGEEEEKHVGKRAASGPAPRRSRNRPSARTDLVVLINGVLVGVGSVFVVTTSVVVTVVAAVVAMVLAVVIVVAGR